VARIATWIQRFEQGDYPMVCARTGRPADKLVPVEAARRSAWPWIFSPLGIVFWLLRWRIDKERVWGRLPFATGQVGGISATWDKHQGAVLLKGLHPGFVAACRAHQRSRFRRAPAFG
jgi:hypothetical protein